MAASLGQHASGGISTLPLGWSVGWNDDHLAASRILQCIDFLEELEQTTGRCIHLDIEPEPGCRLQTSSDLAQFVQERFGDDQRVRRFLRVCYDTCHAAVMREDPAEALDQYASVGLEIGKVQLSSAIDVNFDALAADEIGNAVAALRSLAEPRYLHQTTVLEHDELSFYDNLSDAPLDHPSGHWRVHFHVPIHEKRIGPLCTTQDDLLQTIALLPSATNTYWEVETYTWSVMPNTFQHDNVVNSIVSELRWANTMVKEVHHNA